MKRPDGTPDNATRHDIYRNLNKAKRDPSRFVWSIRAADGPHRGKVSGHAETVVLRDPVFKVAESTRQRIIRDTRRAVCAYIRGTVCSRRDVDLFADLLYRVRISFNPYQSPTFYRCDTRAPVHSADAVIFTADGCFAINPR